MVVVEVKFALLQVFASKVRSLKDGGPGPGKCGLPLSPVEPRWIAESADALWGANPYGCLPLGSGSAI